jgi:hypothetical protein
MSENALGFAAVEAIRAGTLDPHLGTIARAIADRYRALASTEQLRLDAQPARTPEMEASGQHWVWMNGPGEPHWEIRGTGVVG